LRERPDRKERPDYKERSDGPKPKAKNSSPPTDWNDEPAPRNKKPKPQDRAKPPHKPKAKGADKPRDIAGISDTSRRLDADGPGMARPKKPRNKPGGPPPPKGKPSSKKNRARALDAKAARKTKKRGPSSD